MGVTLPYFFHAGETGGSIKIRKTHGCNSTVTVRFCSHCVCMFVCRWWRNWRRSKPPRRPSVQHNTHRTRLRFGTSSTCQRAFKEKKRGRGVVPHFKPGQITYCHWHNIEKNISSPRSGLFRLYFHVFTSRLHVSWRCNSPGIDIGNLYLQGLLLYSDNMLYMLSEYAVKFNPRLTILTSKHPLSV